MKTNSILIFSLLIIFFFSPVQAQTCLTSSEDFASEVVLEDYSILSLRGVTDRNFGDYTKPAEYDEEIIAIFRETINPLGLSVKLQIPTELTEVKNPHLKIVSTSAKGSLSKTNLNSFGNWDVSCSEDSCEFESTDLKMSVQQIQDKQEVILEIQRPLELCENSCQGICLETFSGEKCIDSKTRNQFNTLLRYFTITDEFEDLLDSYRITGTEEIILSEIKPLSNPYINWQEAMRQELVFLTSEGVTDLTREDIESIASQSGRGQAGQNYRIVYDSESKSWISYDKTENPFITIQDDCKEYSLSKKEVKLSAPETFYLIPIIITTAGVLSLILLIIIGRVITKNKVQKENINSLKIE